MPKRNIVTKIEKKSVQMKRKMLHICDILLHTIIDFPLYEMMYEGIICQNQE